ncbi:MFS transporter [Roseiarcaceae bacterium H3SJ34-1]|uniref:MFS transporter n=1 Tax=Terripilifer ovatus TaxID=3032367 RepID=UPI003AB96447|nr:MFS transporter [Roseiarcaceae bacterium H3SJ34-1]
MQKQTLVSSIVASALFMEFLDQTVITTAIPVIAGDMGISPIDLKLGLTSYYLGLVLVTPASGWIGERFGAQRVFLAAVLLFTLGSISCGLSNSLSALVVSRFVQGLGGAMMVPVGRLIVLRSVSRSEMVNALTWLTLPAVFGPMLGPVIGGFVTTYFHWRLIFWINAPIGIIGLALAIFYLPDTPRQPDRGFDRAGYGLVAAGLALVVVGATLMGMGAVSLSLGLAACVLGIGLLALYVRHARRTANPLLDLGLFRLPTFRASFYGGLPFRMANGASPFLMPLFFQLGFGFNAFQSGAFVFLSGLGAIIMKSTTGPLLRRFGFRNILVSNGILNAATLAAIAAITTTTPTAAIALFLLILGFFRSLQYSSISALSFAEVEPAQMASATSITSIVQPLSNSLGVSFGALILELVIHGRGGGAQPMATDFAPAFLAVGVICVTSVFFFNRLSRNAGAEMTGHNLPAPRAAE